MDCMKKIISAPIAVVLYNANIFSGYEAIISDKLFSSIDSAQDWVRNDLLARRTRYTYFQEIVYPLESVNGIYSFEFDEDHYPKRDKDGYIICGDCGKKSGYTNKKCLHCIN